METTPQTLRRVSGALLPKGIEIRKQLKQAALRILYFLPEFKADEI
jgi:hypothetical protein